MSGRYWRKHTLLELIQLPSLWQQQDVLGAEILGYALSNLAPRTEADYPLKLVPFEILCFFI